MAYVVRVVLSYLYQCSVICRFGLCQVVLMYYVMGWDVRYYSVCNLYILVCRDAGCKHICFGTTTFINQKPYYATTRVCYKFYISYTVQVTLKLMKVIKIVLCITIGCIQIKIMLIITPE